MIQELLTLWDEYLVWIQDDPHWDQDKQWNVPHEPTFLDFMEWLRRRGK